MTERPLIIHAIDGRIDPARRHALQSILTRLSRQWRQSLCVLGEIANLNLPQGIESRRICSSFLRFVFPESALRRILPADQPSIVHVWSPDVANLLVPLLRGRSTRSFQAVIEGDPRLIAHNRAAIDWLRQTPFAFVASTARERAALAARGIGPERCAIIRPGVDFAETGRADRASIRAALQLAPHEKAVLLLPPNELATGVRFAAWSALLAERAQPEIRLLLPGDGAQARRVLRLATATDRRRIVHETRGKFALADLLAASDVACYLPEKDAPCGVLAWAMAARRPILASAVPCITELLAHGHNAWLCRPADPRDGARRLLEILDSPAEVESRTRVAHAQAFSVFSRQRMIEQYDGLYSNIAAGNAPAAGISDAAA